MKRHVTKKRVALVLPMTVPGLIEALREEEGNGGESAGLAEVATNRCYLCGNNEGDKRVALTNDREDPVNLTTVHLSTHQVRMVNGFDLAFRLCLECAALIGVFQGAATRRRPSPAREE